MPCGYEKKNIFLNTDKNDVLYMYIFLVIICKQHQPTCSKFYSRIDCGSLSNLRTIKRCSSSTERQLLLWCYSS